MSTPSRNFKLEGAVQDPTTRSKQRGSKNTSKRAERISAPVLARPRQQTVRLLNTARTRLSDIGESIHDSVQDAGERVTAAARRGGRAVARTVKAQQRAAETTIEAHPLRSVLISFAVGVVCGVIPTWLLKRRQAPFWSN